MGSKYLEFSLRTPALGPLLRSVWAFSHDTAAESMQGIIAPDAHVEFVFQTGDPCSLSSRAVSNVSTPRAMIFAQRHGALKLTATGGNTLIAVRMPPAVASVVLRSSLADYWDRPVPLSDVIGREAEDLLDSIANTPLPLVGSLLEAWLLGRLAEWDADDTRNLDLQTELLWQFTHQPLGALAATVGVTARTLRRHCHKYSGLSPKQLVMSGRMLRGCALLRDAEVFSIAEVAYRMGFNDQPAFANAFRHYVGMTPAQFRAEPIVHCEVRR